MFGRSRRCQFYLLENLLKPLRNLIFGRHLGKIICFTEHLLFVHEIITKIKLLMNFGILGKHVGTVTQCLVDPASVSSVCRKTS